MARRTRREMMRAQAERSFIGRMEVQQSFRANVSSDEPAQVLFAISGEGGVGKTSLLDQLQRACDELDEQGVPVTVIRCDDRHPFPIDVIAHAANRLGELAPSDAGIKKLTKQLARYRRLRHTIEADKEAPDLARQVVRPVVSGGVRLARHLPGGGVVKEYVDPTKTGAAAGEIASYLRQRFRNDNDIRLVREPEGELTPLLLNVVNRMASKGRRVILFCDVFERTGGNLERWLWQVLRSDYGDIDPLFMAVVAGRDELGQTFTEFGDAVAFVQLEPFTSDETERYLEQRGITDEELVKVIHRDTAGLPVLVELVASRNPQPGQPIPDVSGDAVERFLSWIEDPKRKSACLHAAIPRWFDAETLAIAMGREEQAADAFEWLQHEAFVRRPSTTVPGFHFHEKVRELMLRHLRTQHPGAVAEAHSRLAEHLQQRIDALGLGKTERWANESFQRFNVEWAYDKVSAAPDNALFVAAEEYLTAFRWNRKQAYAVAWSCEQALTEHDPGIQRSPVVALAEADQADKESDALVALNQLDQLSLSDRVRSDLCWLRWWATPGSERALLDRAIELDDTNFRAFAGLGWHHRDTEHDDAVTALTRAIELNPNFEHAYAIRGGVHGTAGQWDLAIADLTRAIELKPDDPWNHSQRGLVHLNAGRYDQAIADLTRAIELKPDDPWNHANRGDAYHQAGQYDDAVSDFTRAAELNPDDEFAYAFRGLTHSDAGRHNHAIADLTRAIDLKPGYEFAYAYRGYVRRGAGQYDKAVTDLTRAIELKPDDPWNHAQRGLAHLDAKRYDEAIADLTRAIELKPDDPWNHAQRGEAHRRAGDLDQAVTDLTQAIELKPDHEWAYAIRGQTQCQAERHDQAIADLTQAIELKPDDAWNHAQRGRAYLDAGRYDQGIADLTQAIELDESYSWAYAGRGVAHRQAANLDQAIVDLTRAIELDRNSDWAYAQRGTTHSQAGRHDEAIVDATRAVELDPDDPWTVTQLALILLASDDHEGGRAAFDRQAALPRKDADEAGILAAWRRAIGDPQAKETAEAALGFKLADAWDRLGHCLALIVLGRTDEARTLASDSVAKDTEVMFWINRLDLFADVRRLIADAETDT